METRKSNFELLRIVSMIMIIIWHLLLQANILSNTTGILNILLTIIEAIIVVHVNSFILTTGYFQYKKEFKIKKFLNLFFDVWFYKAIILVIILLFNLKTLSKLDILLNLSPINHQEYWFMNCYLILYLISPIINKIINKSTKKELKKEIIIIGIIVSLIPTISNQVVFNNGYGYSVSNFILLYMLGAYINKYDIKLENKKILQYSIILISTNLLLSYIGNYMLNKNSLSNYLGTIITSSSFVYDNPIVIFQTILYFLFFKNLKINNKKINEVSKTTIGIYLIHTNKLLREYVYKYFGYNHFFEHKLLVIPLLIINSLLLFCICSLIENFRLKAKVHILNSSLLEKSKDYIREKYKNFIKMGKEKNSYELLDLFKFVFSIMIVAIHTEILYDFPPTLNWYITHIILRLAVPCFFIMSGFLFGNKILNEKKDLKTVTIEFIKRLTKPLIFWLIIGFIPEFINKYDGSIIGTILSILRNIIFYPYGALWYIYALIIAIGILYFFYKKKKYITPIIIGYILYLFALLGNSYYFMIEHNNLLKRIIDTYVKIFLSTRNGIFIGILLVSMGVYIAKIIKEEKIKDWNLIGCGFILSFLILILETYFIRGKNTLDDNSLFLITPILSSSIVLLLIKLSKKKQYQKLRNLSTGIYFVHRPILAYLSIFITFPSNIIKFTIVLLLSILLTIYLQRKDNNYINQIIK